MSSQTATPSPIDKLANGALARIVKKQWDNMTNHALVFIGAMGGAPKTDSMREVMTNLGAAFGNYEDLQGTTFIITRLCDMFIDEIGNSYDIKLAWIIIGYNGQSVAPNETDREIMLRAGALIAAETPAAAAAMKLPRKLSPAIIALIKKAVKDFKHAHMQELAKLVGVNLDGIPPYNGESICGDAHMIAARLEFAVAESEST
jgi:hypothetical protein